MGILARGAASSIVGRIFDGFGLFAAAQCKFVRRLFRALAGNQNRSRRNGLCRGRIGLPYFISDRLSRMDLGVPVFVRDLLHKRRRTILSRFIDGLDDDVLPGHGELHDGPLLQCLGDVAIYAYRIYISLPKRQAPPSVFSSLDWPSYQ